MYWICSLGMALPARWMASAAACASAGVVTGLHGGGSAEAWQMPGPAPAETEATRPPTRTALETATVSRISSDISMIPRTNKKRIGVTRAASTATAPRSPRLRVLNMAHPLSMNEMGGTYCAPTPPGRGLPHLAESCQQTPL